MFNTPPSNTEINSMRSYTSRVNAGRRMYVNGTYRTIHFGIYFGGKSIDGLEFSDATEFSASVEKAGSDYENATIVASVEGIELARVSVYWDEIEKVEVI